MLIDDFMTINPISTNNQTGNEISSIQHVFFPCFQRLESWNSQKSNDVYFFKQSSNSFQIQEEENKIDFMRKNSSNSMDNFDDNFEKLNFMPETPKQHNLENEDYFSNENKGFFQALNFNQNLNESLVSILPVNDTVIINSSVDLFKKEKDIGFEIEMETKIAETEKPVKKKLKRGKRGPYKKKPKPIIEANIDDKCFPFTTRKSLASNKIEKYLNGNFFSTNIYITDSDGNKKRQKKARKFKPDDIRKKIKVRFHKKIKNLINENLKKAGSNELFSFLPQIFIGNIAKKFNNQYLYSTYEDLLKINFSDIEKDYPNKECDYNQFNKNKKTLEYLSQNPEISRISGFDKVKKMKYRDILVAYFSSDEFEKSIGQLIEEDESAEYIQEYILLAQNYIEYFECL